MLSEGLSNGEFWCITTHSLSHQYEQAVHLLNTKVKQPLDEKINFSVFYVGSEIQRHPVLQNKKKPTKSKL